MSDRQISNKELARRTGYHVNTISKWRSSKDMPKLDQSEIHALCRAINCSVEALLGLSSIDEAAPDDLINGVELAGTV
ncbi:helix-turn-helix domain-containing protein [Acaryochloris marina]|uniref:helix-turn-helix domain-containing protein n=1 Tax=Acaryochloris marina TaxID=155978 RepID=UPI002201C8BF|nr:hypothetical protein AM10699_57310 [Acaryochloris marina MBIC10699]